MPGKSEYHDLGCRFGEPQFRSEVIAQQTKQFFNSLFASHRLLLNIAESEINLSFCSKQLNVRNSRFKSDFHFLSTNLSV